MVYHDRIIVDNHAMKYFIEEIKKNLLVFKLYYNQTQEGFFIIEFSYLALDEKLNMKIHKLQFLILLSFSKKLYEILAAISHFSIFFAALRA